MTLYRRNGVFHSRVWVDGVCYTKSTESRHRRFAEQRDREHREEIVQRRYGFKELKPEMKFAELAGRFISDGDVLPWHRDRLKILLPEFSDMEIGSLTPAVVNQFRRRRKRQNPKLTDATVNRDVQCLRRILNWAVEQGFITSNPLSHLHLVPERPKRRGVLGISEETPLLLAAAPHLREAIICALDAGLRRSEIFTQLAEDVDRERRVLSVTRSKTVGGEQREIPLTSRLHDLIVSKKIKKGLLFALEGKPVKDDIPVRKPIKNVKTAWKAAVRRSKIRPLRFHDLRHTFNTRLMEAGVIQDVRRELMGHSSGGKRNTNLIYTHVELPQKRQAIRKLDAWLEEQRKAEAENADDKHE